MGLAMTVSHRFVIITAIFVTCLITANTIAVKVIGIGPFILPAAMNVPDALYRVQQARAAMIIVEDADGKHVGLATIKDLVEEIVGELAVW